MKTTFAVSALLAASLLLASCGGGEGGQDSSEPPSDAPAPATQAEGPGLSDHPWRLVAIDMADGEDVEPEAGLEPIVDFSDEANPTGSRLMTGWTGCNEFNATYDAGRGGRLAISPAAMTRMACEESVMRIERLFVIGLESASTYVIEDGGLSLDFGGGILHFVADEGDGPG